MTRVVREGEIVPAALAAVLAGAAPWSRWPVGVDVDAAASGCDVLAAHASRLARAMHLATAGRTPRPVAEAAAEALDRLRGEVELSEAGRRALEADAERFLARLPGGDLVGLGPDAPRALYVRAVAAARRPRVAAVVESARRLAARLEEMLRVDAAHGAAAAVPGAVAAALGEMGERLDASALAGRLEPLRGSVRLDASRRARLERLVAELHAGAAVLEGGPDVRFVEGEDALARASAAFDATASETLAFFRALRAARLEAEGSFVPERHEAALARFDWRAYAADEKAALPRVTAAVTASDVPGALDPLSVLLRSGRPIHVLVERAALPARWTDGGAPLDAATFAMAHRNVFVVQGTLARPADLARGLARLGESLLPAVVAVAVPRWDAPESGWADLLAADAGRVAPTFLYDPAAGTHWAHRFEAGDNPQPDRAWPGFGDEAFTFAHAAALAPAWRESFRPVRADGDVDPPISIEAWVASDPQQRVDAVPCLRAVGADGAEEVLEIDPDLALACLDRFDAWRGVRELAGSDDEYARRAAAAAREQAREEAALEVEAVRAAHAEELDRVRREVATEAIDRVVRVLLGTAEAVPVPAAVPAATGEAAPAPSAAPAAAAASAPEPEPIDAEPYVVSALCTSCQDCININPRMFRYDGNKQAYVADAAAGTFDELVRAAEKCPARCIHTGLPRPGDPTVDDALLARAAKFR